MLLNTSIDEGKQLEPWMGSNVEQMSSLRKLTIINECVGGYLDYVVYKYPRLEEIVLDVAFGRLNTVNTTTFKSNMDHAIAAIAKIPTKLLHLMMRHSASFVDIIRHFDEKGYTVAIIKKVMGNNRPLLKIEGL